jgi:Fur family peroxide stress response transcriptional regulator
MDQAVIEDRMQAFRRRCEEKGLALTHQRQVIYRVLAATTEHPTPEAVYEKVRRQMPSLSLGTVYKNIRIFTEAGLLNEVSLLHASLRLDANLESHHHLVCVECKAVTDLSEQEIRPRGPIPEGFEVQRYNVEVLGRCAKCSSKNKRRIHGRSEGF